MKRVPLVLESVDWEPDPLDEQHCYFTVHCLNPDGGRVFVMPCDVGDDVITEIGLDPAIHPSKEQVAAAWLRHQWGSLPVVGLDAGLRNLAIPAIPPHVVHLG